jgi:hypothetical protein
VHDGFVPTGSPAGTAGVPAITVGAGTRWLEAYQALLPHGRYVQGGGCVSVGAAGGFIQGGGFGSLSRRYGTAAGNMLQAEVVLASGEIVTVNAVQHPDLFWALRGGGGGTFGVVCRLTLATHPAPRTLGRVAGTITAGSDADFRRLLGRLALVLPALCDDHWGEHVGFACINVAEFGLLAASGAAVHTVTLELGEGHVVAGSPVAAEFSLDLTEYDHGRVRSEVTVGRWHDGGPPGGPGVRRFHAASRGRVAGTWARAGMCSGRVCWSQRARGPGDGWVHRYGGGEAKAARYLIFVFPSILSLV